MGRFKLGQLVVSRNALDTGVNPLLLIFRHFRCDWGRVSVEDKILNDQAVDNGLRIVSKYTMDGYDFFVITEASREYTTVMLCSDY